MTTKNTKVTADEVLRRAQDLHEDIRAWRREIHRYPELTFTEQRTAGLVNSVLVDREIETETEVAKTGVVGHIRGGSGPVVALRADMDALPIQEINGTDYRQHAAPASCTRAGTTRTRLCCWAPLPF